ncbi:MAG: hypothetical protein WC525_07505 [Candidatus Thermoplasmatota archaeon]
MNLYLLSQTKNTGYDTYDSIIVAAPNETNGQEDRSFRTEIRVGNQRMGGVYLVLFSKRCYGQTDRNCSTRNEDGSYLGFI